jgi:hypothetical protein
MVPTWYCVVVVLSKVEEVRELAGLTARLMSVFCFRMCVMGCVRVKCTVAASICMGTSSGTHRRKLRRQFSNRHHKAPQAHNLETSV